MSAALSGCASNWVSPHFQPRGSALLPRSALDPRRAEEATAGRGSGRGASRPRGPCDAPAPECLSSDGETEAWTEQCGPKPVVQAPSASSAYDHPSARNEWGGRGWISSADWVPRSPDLRRPSSGGRGPRYEAPRRTSPARRGRPAPVPQRKQTPCLQRARRAARPRSDEDSMEPRTAAEATEPGRARGSIPRSCCQQSRWSV